MAMNLSDRPSIARATADHRIGGATVSVSIHLLFATIALVMFRAIPQQDAAATNALIPAHMIWLPHQDAGGGQDGGGDRSLQPPRRAHSVGHDAATVPDAAQLSDRATVDPPEETPAIPARPMSDATATLVGVIEGDPAARSAGPGATGVGTADGNDPGGLGSKPGPGFGLGAFGPGGPGVTTPTIIEQVSPRYTVEAMRLRIQGVALIECVVLPDGTVGDARVMRSLDARYGLDAEAIAAAKRWRFRPGTLNGKPVPVVVTIELTFTVR
jgi:TonB family protein